MKKEEKEKNYLLLLPAAIVKRGAVAPTIEVVHSMIQRLLKCNYGEQMLKGIYDGKNFVKTEDQESLCISLMPNSQVFDVVNLINYRQGIKQFVLITDLFGGKGFYYNMPIKQSVEAAKKILKKLNPLAMPFLFKNDDGSNSLLGFIEEKSFEQTETWKAESVKIAQAFEVPAPELVSSCVAVIRTH